MAYELHCADCRALLPYLGKFDFIFADPPFNIGHSYSGYDDSQDLTEYHALIYRTITQLWTYNCDGIMVLYGLDKLVEFYLHAERFLQMNRVAWINWNYNFGQCTRSNWVDARTHIMVYAKHEDYTWNPEAVLVDSARVKYGDKRINDTENGGRRVPGTVWGTNTDGPGWGRVTGNSKERWKSHPNQLPQRLLHRLIMAYTNWGDSVLDPFMGSGTTGVVASREGRYFTGIDISKENVDSAAERIEGGYYFGYSGNAQVNS